MRRGFCLAGFLLAEGNRGWAFCLPGKTGVRRGHTPGNNRVRARLGKGTNPVRDLLTAGVRACEAWKRHKPGARFARRRRGLFPCPGKQEPDVGKQLETAACVRDAGKKKTRSASCSAQPRVRARRGEEKDTERDLLGAAAHPETTACVRGMVKKKTGCATCSPQVCPPQARVFCLPGKTGARRRRALGMNRVRARLGKDTNRVRVLLTAGAQARR